MRLFGLAGACAIWAIGCVAAVAPSEDKALSAGEEQELPMSPALDWQWRAEVDASDPDAELRPFTPVIEGLLDGAPNAEIRLHQVADASEPMVFEVAIRQHSEDGVRDATIRARLDLDAEEAITLTGDHPAWAESIFMDYRRMIERVIPEEPALAQVASNGGFSNAPQFCDDLETPIPVSYDLDAYTTPRRVMESCLLGLSACLLSAAFAQLLVPVACGYTAVCGNAIWFGSVVCLAHKLSE